MSSWGRPPRRHRAHPRRFLTDVRTSCPDLWENNPWITPLDEKDPGVRKLRCDYPLVHRSNEAPVHFIHGFTEFLSRKLGVPIQPTQFKGDLHISDLEKSWYSQVRELLGEDVPFWIVVSGGKFDFTAKWWDPRRTQQVDSLLPLWLLPHRVSDGVDRGRRATKHSSATKPGGCRFLFRDDRAVRGEFATWRRPQSAGQDQANRRRHAREQAHERKAHDRLVLV